MSYNGGRIVRFDSEGNEVMDLDYGDYDALEKPQTNADRIRAMTDEELAEYLDGVCHDLWQMFVKDPRKMWLDWLKQEVKDG